MGVANNYNLVTTLAQMNVAKQVYDQNVSQFPKVPALLSQNVPLETSGMPGEQYIKAVQLRFEQGFTGTAAGFSAGASGVPATPNGLTDVYNPTIPMQISKAYVSPPQLTLVSQISLDTVLRTNKNDSQAIEAVTVAAVKNIVDSCDLRLEVGMLYGDNGGATGIGTIASTGTVTSIDSTHYAVVVTITQSEWAAAIWTTGEGAAIDIFSNTSTTSPINSTTSYTLISSNTAQSPVIAAVNPNTRQVTILADQTTASSISTSVSNGSTPVVRFGGMFGVDQVGLVTQLKNTGVLFGIDASTYNMWLPNQFDNQGSALTFTAINNAAARGARRGVGIEDMLVFVNPGGWADALTDQAALRRYGSEMPKKTEAGSLALEFLTQTGKLELQAHPFLKEGLCLILPKKRMRRVGTQDWTFLNFEGATGEAGEGVFEKLQTSNRFQAIRYTCQQIFCSLPACATIMTGIVNTNN